MPDHRFTFLLLFSLASCTATKTPPPASSITVSEHEDWSSDLSYGLSTKPGDLTNWWKVLDDRVLNELVDSALKENHDLKIAAARVREARAQRGIAGANRFPTLNASGAAQKVKSGDAPSSELFSSGFDASWELDIFGRVSQSVTAADADLAATRESFYDVRISMLAEVALNYVEVRSFQNRLAIAQENVKSQQETYRISKERYDLKVTSELDMKQAESNLESTKSQIPPLEAGLARAMNRLSVLLGEKPGTLNKTLSRRGSVPVASGEIAVGIPADIMRRRPDIRRSERELAAQSARVGVAKADLYPRFTFNGNLSLQSSDAGSLFSPTARTSSFGPAFQWNVLSGGSVRNNIKVQSEKQQQSLYRYEQSVLRALEEIENALVAYGKEHDKRTSLAKAVAASEQAVKLANDLYKGGLKDFTTVLDAQRSLFTQQDQLANSSADITSNLIRLYKALGGGWDAQVR